MNESTLSSWVSLAKKQIRESEKNPRQDSLTKLSDATKKIAAQQYTQKMFAQLNESEHDKKIENISAPQLKHEELSQTYKISGTTKLGNFPGKNINVDDLLAKEGDKIEFPDLYLVDVIQTLRQENQKLKQQQHSLRDTIIFLAAHAPDYVG